MKSVPWQHVSMATIDNRHGVWCEITIYMLAHVISRIYCMSCDNERRVMFTIMIVYERVFTVAVYRFG